MQHKVADYLALQSLLEEPSHNEVKCGDYLSSCLPYLVRVTAASINGVIRENRVHYGSSDFIIIYDAKNSFGRIERHAVIWELKAPQCFLMERDDNNNRFRPTLDLIKAENQLIHYFHEISNSEDFRRRHRINNRDNIKMGGIIIGRDNTLINASKYNQLVGVAENSVEIRTTRIYDKAEFVVWTWDRILDYLKPLEMPSQ